MYTLESKDPIIIKCIAGTGGVTKGCLVTISSGKVIKAAAAPTAATIVGIATADADADAVVGIELVKGKKVRATYAGTTKTTVADTDFGKVFDLTDENKVNLDDTTGGCCLCVGYDNLAKAIDFLVVNSFIYVG